jgi:1,2-diacylglycerol 3-alpha-glucosyltransferase
VTRLVVQWPRLGPYHLARLRAAHRLLKTRGIEVIALETASNDTVYEWRLESDDEPFQREQVFPGRTFESIMPAEMHREVVRKLDELQPDAVAIHTYSFPDSRACVHWCRTHRRGAIVMTDSKADDAIRSPMREGIKAALLRGYDAALLAGSASRDYLNSLGIPRERIWLGYDVVDNAYFAARAAAAKTADSGQRTALPGLADDAPFFLASNRFIERKNLERLLDAYAAYRERAEDPWRLILLGDGPLRPRLEARATSGVVFAGFRQIDEIPAYYGRASAFVHAALVDQWALVINEAMACGLPVIVSTGAGCHGDLIIPGENGFVFDPLDESALTGHLLQMTGTPDLERMGERSREIISDWSPTRFAESLAAATEAAVLCGDRPYGLVLRGLIAAMRMAGRSTTSFHAIES